MKNETIKKRNELLSSLKGKILDVGCNTNPEIHKSLIDVYGIDNVFGIDLCDVNLGSFKNIKIGNAEEVSKYFKKGYFDSIFAGEIIEHLENPLYFLRECFKTLNKGGRIIITTPNMTSFRYILSAFKGNLHTASNEPQHLYAWDIVLLERLISKANFKITQKGYIKSNGGLGRKIPFKKMSWHLYVIAEK